MLRSVGCGVVKHWPADDAIVGSVVPVHSAVETVGGCANSSLSAGVGGVVRVVKSAMFVIWETFDLDASCFP
jgi:hypothetical protein